MSRVILSVTAVVVGIVACGSPSRAARSEGAELSAEGVSSLSYAPKPFTDTLSRMRVDFTTTGPARPGHFYDVYVFVKRPDDEGGCVSLGVSNGTRNARRILGGTNQSHRVWLAGIRASPTDFCSGKAELTVISRPIRHASKDVRVLRTISFRILRA